MILTKLDKVQMYTCICNNVYVSAKASSVLISNFPGRKNKNKIKYKEENPELQIISKWKLDDRLSS